MLGRDDDQAAVQARGVGDALARPHADQLTRLLEHGDEDILARLVAQADIGVVEVLAQAAAAGAGAGVDVRMPAPEAFDQRRRVRARELLERVAVGQPSQRRQLSDRGPVPRTTSSAPLRIAISDDPAGVKPPWQRFEAGSRYADIACAVGSQ